ncbi:hypothetical protein EV356DRAFT_507665 [Viridothelium virens]|uniref:Uncharacterized protein n=1 Tax=Viridothelium virens TaxID=1048519 RepID=A0A6A6H0T6_VIRVR|nr:hypothetical protein EV356DRAFT_507665 [Viridothelium virens]
MLPSWQNEIWKTAWKNPALETLELGSAWTPTFRGDGTKSWKFIDSDWKMPDIGATGVIEHL